jgi:nicotinamide phosphoribosyltransferase
MKKSAKGLLRVEKEGDNFVLYDQQTREQEAQGALETVFYCGSLHRDEKYETIRYRLGITTIKF